MGTWALSDHLVLAASLTVAGLLLGLAERIDPESLDAGRRDPAERRRHLAWLGGYVVMAPVAGALGAALVAWVDNRAPRILDGVPVAARWAVALVVVDVTAYGLHRLSHRWAPLWRVHAAHHRATDVRWWTAMRFHPVNALLDLTVPYGVAAAFGVGSGAIAAAAGVVTVVTLFAHADVHVPGRWVDQLVATPRYHRTHHEVDGHASNLALVLPALDALFGTRAPLTTVSSHGRRFGVGYPSNAHPTVNDDTLASALATTASSPSR